MIYILIFFVVASLLLYTLLGGSDYGAGILELIPVRDEKLRERQKHTINYAIGPVWEANHVWLIIIAVILFMAFPTIFNAAVIYLHVPFLALLVGIVVRGATFSFRHYDPANSPKAQRAYTALFGISSLWTAFWLGISAASLHRGLIGGGTTACEKYIAPWLGIYPVTVGLFVACIFAFLASVYLTGETKDPELEKLFTRRAATLNILLVVVGIIVFLASLLEKTTLLEQFRSHPLAIAPAAIATLLLIALWKFIKMHRVVLARLVAGAQVTMVLLGWLLLYFPDAAITAAGPASLFIDNTDVLAPTRLQLTLALLIGSCIIFPSLICLLVVFKKGEPPDKISADQHE